MSESLMKILQREEGMSFPCNGKGSCGKCKVRVTGELNEPTGQEKKHITKKDLKNHIRLACQVKVLGEYRLEKPKKEKIKIDTAAPSLLKKKEPLSEKGIGMAVDIGTTTLTAAFYRMDNGKKVYDISCPNSQRAYGSDVISRISYTMEDADGLSVLTKLIQGDLNWMIEAFAKNCDSKPEKITAAVLSGNTTMLHLLCEMAPSSLAQYPYQPQSLFGEFVKPYEVGLPIHKKAVVYLTDCLSAFVGGDIVAGLLDSGMYKKKGPSILIDFGTNGEMVLGGSKGLICCASAAGPAFEGANITCGCPAVKGAVYRAYPRKKQIQFETIGKKPAVGVCGSGLMSIIASMLQIGMLDETGRLQNGFEQVKEDKLMIDEKNDIYLSGMDIRQLQLAKAAVAAGIETLMKEQKIHAKQLQKVYVAGGFGFNIHKRSACKIGLFPKEFQEKIVYLGNASLCGAARILGDRKKIQTMKAICKKTSSMNLAESSYFSEQYLEKMSF